MLATLLAVAPLVGGGTAYGHPWHHHRAEPAAAAEANPGIPARAEAATEHRADVPAPAADTAARPSGRFFLVAAPGKNGGKGADLGAAFAPFEKLGAVTTRRDDRWFYVESRGIPDHPLMVGIRNWQQQVPLPQDYTGGNAWQIPLEPVPAREPASTRNRFLRGAIALAVNGIPIFNPLNNRGEDALEIGELDEYGGHCGRADDYHYHVAPVHLEKVVGKGQPIAWALDGYPVYGRTEPDGGPRRPLDRLGGHEDGQGGYHYHALEEYPHLIGGFRGEVIERDGQVDPQPRARGVREALPPLRGARIIGFESAAADTRKLTYEIDGRKGSVEYTTGADGSARFTFTDVSGRTTTESYAPRGRGPGGGPGGPRGGPEPRRPRNEQRNERHENGPGGRQPPPRSPPPAPRASGGPSEDRSAAKRTAADRPAAREGELAVSSPATPAGGNLPVEFTCDGAGVSPPLEWAAGPPGTKSYALTLWHEAPDAVKSYWVVYGIPAEVTRLPRDARNVGTIGLNDKRRAAYDPMCSKGPGRKTYHVTVHALSAAPNLPAAAATREALLAAIRDTVLAEGTLTFSYEREGR